MQGYQIQLVNFHTTSYNLSQCKKNDYWALRCVISIDVTLEVHVQLQISFFWHSSVHRGLTLPTTTIVKGIRSRATTTIIQLLWHVELLINTEVLDMESEWVHLEKPQLLKGK